MGTILIAVREEERSFLQRALASRHHLRFATSLRDAGHELDRDIDAVLCSVHFDDGQLFELIELAKLQACTRAAPVYGLVVEARHFSHHFVESLRSAVDLLGGQGVLDLAGLRRECGDAEAVQMLNTAVDTIVDCSRRCRHRPMAAQALLAA
jgi:hypothetical protein